ncbi:DUF2294 domain-containing protein [Metabacillus litoralis]|uniref:DUF2294 domain-containing protein n=2 Tax=Bacillaceae TaxID=186817 RepID=UPI00203C0405|nr:Na-translocating system protein MpsC family protein [Metabacillus litoralis]MCM3165090.1 DUF2294 domain-containing protein [Metabacillus litoralis]
MDDNEIVSLQKDISGYVGKMFRESFGKGPQSVYTSVGYTYITIYLRNFLTPSERVLLEQDQVMTIMQMRDKLMDTLIPELKAFIEISTSKKIREIYYDWNLHNKSGMITCISSESFTPKDSLKENYLGKEKIDYEVIQISKQA